MRLTSDFRTTPERFRYWLPIMALSVTLEMTMFSLSLLVDSTPPERWLQYRAMYVVSMIMLLDGLHNSCKIAASDEWSTCRIKNAHWVQ